MAILELQHVGYVVENGKSQGTRILDGVSFSVEKGESLTILGPSGSGKSTVLRLCNRLLNASEGQILFDGQPICESPAIELRRRVGLVFQTPILLKNLDLKDNLLFGLRCKQGPSESDDDIAKELLLKVGLSPKILERDYNEISVGQAQRLCLSRTLATDPEVLLLDEPTASLDPTNKQEIENLIRSLQKERGLTTLFVTHDLAQARRLGGHATVIVEGKTIETGQVDDVLGNSKYELTRRFASGNLLGE